MKQSMSLDVILTHHKKGYQNQTKTFDELYEDQYWIPITQKEVVEYIERVTDWFVIKSKT
jgi:hypothetical protein